MVKSRSYHSQLSIAAAQYAFTSYHIFDDIQDGSSIRIRSTPSESSPSSSISQDCQDLDLIDVSVFRTSNNGLAFVGKTRGAIPIDPDDPNRYRLLVVSIRGTERASLQNWMTNLSIRRGSICSGSAEKIHAGFLNHWKSLVDAGLLKNVVDRLDSRTKILITGHSLGGAIAFISAYEISELIYHAAEILVYTFGAPRIGNDVFERNYRQRVPSTFSIGHPLDPIRALGSAAVTCAGSWVEQLSAEVLHPSTLLSGVTSGIMFLTTGPLAAARSSAIAVRSIPPMVRYVRLFATGVCVGFAIRAFCVGIKFHSGYCSDFVAEIIPASIEDTSVCEIIDCTSDSLSS